MSEVALQFVSSSWEEVGVNVKTAVKAMMLSGNEMNATVCVCGEGGSRSEGDAELEEEQ